MRPIAETAIAATPAFYHNTMILSSQSTFHDPSGADVRVFMIIIPARSRDGGTMLRNNCAC